MTKRILKGTTERIVASFFDENNQSYTADTPICSILRISDGFRYDWNDGTFKNSGWVESARTMSVLNGNTYYVDLSTANIADGTYLVATVSAGAANSPQFGELTVDSYFYELSVMMSSVYNNNADELKVNTWLELAGNLVTTAGNAKLTVYQQNGTELISLQTDASDDAQGVFSFTVEEPGFSSDNVYYAITTIDYNGVTYRSAQGIITLD